MGWNQLDIKSKECPLLKDIPDGSYVYFCHSFYPDPKEKSNIAATCDYGIDFASIVWQDNIYGTQFHPEKSQSVGLSILRNFVNL
jgi:glutamine amidotransferase